MEQPIISLSLHLRSWLKFQGFDVKFFTVLLIFSKFSSIIIGFIFNMLSSVDCLAFRVSFKSKVLELDFLMSIKTRFYGQSLSGRCFLHRYDFFSRFLLPSIYQNISESINQVLFKEMWHESTILSLRQG